MMRFIAVATAILSLLASASAFSTAPMNKVSVAATQHTRLNLMTPEETEKLLTQASDCADGECSLDEVSDLIDVLKTQQKELFERVEQIKGMVKQLETVNTSGNRKVDEVRETVRAIYRVFQLGDKASNNDYPKLMKPTGWSGDVGDGPKTAWDVLPPKKYTPK